MRFTIQDWCEITVEVKYNPFANDKNAYYGKAYLAHDINGWMATVDLNNELGSETEEELVLKLVKLIHAIFPISEIYRNEIERRLVAHSKRKFSIA